MEWLFLATLAAHGTPIMFRLSVGPPLWPRRSTNISLTAVTSCADVPGPQTINPSDLGAPLDFFSGTIMRMTLVMLSWMSQHQLDVLTLNLMQTLTSATGRIVIWLLLSINFLSRTIIWRNYKLSKTYDRCYWETERLMNYLSFEFCTSAFHNYTDLLQWNDSYSLGLFLYRSDFSF